MASLKLGFRLLGLLALGVKNVPFLPSRKTEHHDILWALASDIGAGPFLSMFDVMRSFVKQNTAAGINGRLIRKRFTVAR